MVEHIIARPPAAGVFPRGGEAMAAVTQTRRYVLATRIEIEATVVAHPVAVWPALVDPARWLSAARENGGPDAAPGGSDSAVGLPVVLETLGNDTERVGGRRRCRATLLLPLAGPRVPVWTECVTDLACPWTIEWEALDLRPMRRWRLRIWLLEAAQGQTRLRCRLTYTPRTLWLRCADSLVLRRAVRAALAQALTSFVQLFDQAPGESSTSGDLGEESPAEHLAPGNVKVETPARPQGELAQDSEETDRCR